MQSEKSQLNIGNDCVILYRSYLNTTCKITIGNEVGIGGYCLIFTHSAWKNVLEGNPYKFSDVDIKDNVWIPWNVMILPSVTIEKDVIIGAGSVVTKSLPPAVFAAGVPAKIIKKQTEVDTLSIKEKNKIVLEVMADFKEYVCNFIKLKDVEYSADSYNIVITHENEKRRLVYTLTFENLKENDTIIAFKIPFDIKRRYNWIEFDTLKSNTDSIIAQHFIQFVRRYGIRIHALS